jgi:hypothetical protein
MTQLWHKFELLSGLIAHGAIVIPLDIFFDPFLAEKDN